MKNRLNIYMVSIILIPLFAFSQIPGTVKWIYDVDGSYFKTAPAVDDNGTIYIQIFSEKNNCD